MLIFSALLFVLLLVGAKVETQCSDALDRDRTNAIKGVCIFLVFCRHIAGYLPVGCAATTGLDARIAGVFNRMSGQLIVVMFLFYSGYGIAKAISERGSDYLAAFPKRRILNTLLNFDVAVLVFAGVSMLLGMNLTFCQIAKALLGWESVGNSNWYIFVIVLCYGAAWLSSTVMSMKVGDLGGGAHYCRSSSLNGGTTR